jgi:2-polyprenyl-3-methyl-5-hydroxy-6-metoxy-1,4-benzoquinol methylase
MKTGDQLDMASYQVKVTEQVTQFYRVLPFNYEQTVAETCRTIQASNQIAAAYPALDAILASAKQRVVLDVGCGAGWFVNTVAHHYGLDAVGVDLCEPAIHRAQAVSERLALKGRVRYTCADLFHLRTIQLTRSNQFFLVNSLGVLHHTHDCREALLNITSLVKPNGFIHVGLYHRYGRQPFLDLFQPYRVKYDNTTRERDRQAIEQQAFRVYRTLHASTADETLLRSWFRDQVFHPHESQHTFQELHGWLTSVGFQCLSTSINKFQTPNDWRTLFEEEKKMHELSHQRNIREKKYFPGFFTVLAQRRSQIS